MKLKFFIQKRVTAMLLLSFVFNATCKAQLWDKTYVEDRPIMLFSSIIKSDTAYKIIGLAADKLAPYRPRALAANINLDGLMTAYKVQIDSSEMEFGVFTNSLIQTSKGDFAFTGYANDSFSYLLFARFDSLLDSLEIYRYYTPNTYAFQGYSIFQHPDNHYYIAGVRTASSNKPNVVLLKIDSNANKVWEKYYGVSNFAEIAKSIIELQNGNMMLGSCRSDYTQGNQQFNTWLIEVDTGGGGVVREWFDSNDSTYVAEGLRQTQDGGFIYAAQKKTQQTINSISFVGSIVKLDNLFNKEWTYLAGIPTDVTGFGDLELLPDGSIIACGRYSYRHGWIIKLSSQGEVIWDRTYVGISDMGSQNILTDIDVLPDGSLIAVGQCQHSGQTPPQVGWFLKLDSNGCEIENCTVGIEPGTENQEPRQIQVWPNPFSSDLSISITGEHVSSATFTITNLMGQVVYQQTETNLATGYTKMLDLSYLPNGVYFVAVGTGDGTMVERVVKE